MAIIGTTPAVATNQAIDKAIASVLLRKLELRVYFLFTTGLYDELHDAVDYNIFFYKFFNIFNTIFVLNVIWKKFVWGLKCLLRSYSVRIVKYDELENQRDISKKKK